MNKYCSYQLKRKNIQFFTIDGITKPRSEWLREYDIPSYLITNRMKSGLSFEEAIKKPRRVSDLRRR